MRKTPNEISLLDLKSLTKEELVVHLETMMYFADDLLYEIKELQFQLGKRMYMNDERQEWY